MKSLFPYLVMVILFLAGTRLVNRQQQHARLIQDSALVEPAAPGSMIAVTERQQVSLPSANTAKSTTATRSANHKRNAGESKKSKKLRFQ